MHILFCNFHEAHGGGHDTYLLSLIQTLKARHEVALACPPSAQLYLTLRTEIHCFAINYKAIFREYTFFIRLKNFKQWVEKQAFDIIRVNGSADHRVLLLIYPFLKKRPKLILTKHNALCIKWGAWLRMCYFTDAIIAVSRFTERQLLQAGVKKSLVHTIVNGVDTDFFTPLASQKKNILRQHYGLNNDDFIFVSNAGTAPCKNWPSLLAAVARLPLASRKKIKIMIAGKLPSPVEQAALIKKFDLRRDQVVFLGLLADTRDSMTLGDAGFVLSNTEETISFACREMMAMGLPVMVSNFGGLPENITDQVDGWIVPVNDIAAVTRCILQLVSKNNLTQMGQRARKKAVKNFNKEQFINATVALYQRLISA